MLSKNKIKFIQSLHRKKNRLLERLYLIEGDKMAKEALLYPGVQHVYATNEWMERHNLLISKKKVEATIVNERELKAISTMKTANQVLLLMAQPEAKLDRISLESGFHLYLDQIQDPGNMGTILRCADWFGVASVFCSEGCAEVFNPKVVQASMGAILRVNVLTTTLPQLLENNDDLPVYGTLLEGVNINDLKPEQRGLIVIGNEGKGISPEVQALISHKITIPKGKSGQAESLNAAVATGIVLAKFYSNR